MIQKRSYTVEKVKTIQLSEVTWRIIKQAALDRDMTIKELVAELVERSL